LAGERPAILHKKNGRRNEFSSHFVVVTEAVTYFFLAAGFFAGAAFLAGAFLAAGFLAASFFAGAFFAGAFLIAIDNPPFQSAVAGRRKF
jgi:small-conductance mechanosensitive channel